MSYPFQQVRRMEYYGMDFSQITHLAKGHKKCITEKTIRNIYSDPLARRHLDTVKAIREAHDATFGKTVHCYRVGVSPGLQDMVDRYNRAFLVKRNEDFDNEIEAIKNSVAEELRIYPMRSNDSIEVIWRGASLHWILGRILSDELRTLRDNYRKHEETEKTKQLALQHYEEARKLFMCLYNKAPGVVNIAYAFEINRIMVVFNSIPVKDRRDNQHIIDLFRYDNHRHRRLCIKLLEDEYFQWQAARNLMTDYQYMEDKSGYVCAFELLVKACKKFKNLNYKPGLVDSIKNDDDTNLYIDVLRKKRIAE